MDHYHIILPDHYYEVETCQWGTLSNVKNLLYNILWRRSHTRFAGEKDYPVSQVDAAQKELAEWHGTDGVSFTINGEEYGIMAIEGDCVNTLSE